MATTGGSVAAGGAQEGSWHRCWSRAIQLRYSDHYEKQGKRCSRWRGKRGWKASSPKKRDSIYQERRSSEWLKIKIAHRLEAVIGGYTEPEGSRAHFGSIVLGLYDKQGRLIHVGQAGSGFDQKSLDEMWKLLKKRETKKNPFYGEVEALRKVYWVKPELVAEIEYAEWTDGASDRERPKIAGPSISRPARRQRSEGMCAGAGTCRCELRTVLLLDLLHRQQRPVVAAARVDGAGYDRRECVSQFRIFRHQGLHHRNIVLIGLIGVGNVRCLILHDQIQIIAHNLRKKCGELVGCGVPAERSAVLPFAGKSAGCNFLRLVVQAGRWPPCS